MKEVFLCPRCSNHCQVTYEMDNDTLVSMDGILCGSGMTEWITRILAKEFNKETVLSEKS